MSDKRQTAVEWAFEQITNIDWKHLSDSDRNDLFEQAKQFERKQIEEAYNQSDIDGSGKSYGHGKLYYDQTYGK
jgi:hypothetical protein